MENNKARDIDAIIKGYKEGMSLRKLGAAHGISHEWVRKLLASAGLDRWDGGGAITGLKSVRARAAKRRKATERRERHSREFWGMSRADFESHVAEYGDRHVIGSPMRAYVYQRSNAIKRGLQWEFTFSEWWRVWLESGKWGLRGRHKGEFVMARYGDGAAPYSPSSVYICTTTENLKDGFISLPHRRRKKAAISQQH